MQTILLTCVAVFGLFFGGFLAGALTLAWIRHARVFDHQRRHDAEKRMQ